MIVQAILKTLRREYWALKTAFAATATNIPLTTKTIDFSTNQNRCHYVTSSYDFYGDEVERVVVTLTTKTGANTFAKLEISGNAADAYPTVRRVPFQGGARWVVSNGPRYDGGNWAPTNYTFTVHTMLDGELSAKMAWEN